MEYAGVDPSGNLTLHVTVPYGQSINRASLTIDSQIYTLRAEPVPLDVVQWLVLDASDGVVAVQPVIQEQVKTLLNDNDRMTGIRTYNESVTELPLTASSTALSFLSDYTATSGRDGCVWDALNTLPEFDANKSQKVLLITGTVSPQFNCNQLQPPQSAYTIDVIQVSDSADDTLQQLSNQTNGSFSTATLRTIQTRINEKRILWSQPTYRVQGEIIGYRDGLHPLQVQLSSGTELETSIRLTEVSGAAANTGNTGGVVGLATVPPLATVSTGANPQTEPTAALATVAPQPTAIAQGDNTIAATAMPTAQTQPTTPIVATITDSSNELPELEPAPETETEIEAENTGALAFITETNPIILAGIALILGAVVLLVIVGLGTSRTNTQTMANDVEMVTDIYNSVGTKTSILNLNDPPQQATDDDEEELDLTDIFDEEEEELLLTDIAEDDELQAMIQQASPAVHGWIRLSGERTVDYPVEHNMSIGRSPECDIPIMDDKSVSRQHVRLEVRDDAVYLIRESNKTQVVIGGRLVLAPTQLHDNDVIHLSPNTRFAFITRKDSSPAMPDDDEDFDDEMTLL